MPAKRLEFIKSALNLANDTTPGAFTDPITGVAVPGGGLVLGDYIDVTDAEAATFSGPNQLLFGGRYRRIKVDSGATAANVKAGTVAVLAVKSPIVAVQIATAGTGQTNGTYVISSTGGGGTGAQVTVVVAGGLVTSATVTAQGQNYTSAPTFTVAAGGTPGTLSAEVGLNTYVVTSYDVSGSNLSLPRGIFLNAVTPGNYGWIQENGTATVLAGGTVASATVGAWVDSAATGVVATRAASGSPIGVTVGIAIDLPVINTLFRAQLELPVWQG